MVILILIMCCMKIVSIFSGVEIRTMLRESKWILAYLLGKNLCENLCILHLLSMYRTIFYKNLFLFSQNLLRRILARMDSWILAEILALFLDVK